MLLVTVVFFPSTFFISHACCTGATPAVGAYFFFTFLKNGAVMWPQDVVSPRQTLPRLSKMCVAIWQALTCSVGVKGSNWWKRWEQTRDHERFLFTTASCGRISFVHFGLLQVAEQKFRRLGLREMCIWRVRVPEGWAIYNRCVYFRAEEDQYAFHLNTCFSGSKIATEGNVGRDQKWTGLYCIKIIPNLDRPPKQIFAMKKKTELVPVGTDFVQTFFGFARWLGGRRKKWFMSSALVYCYWTAQGRNFHAKA